MLEGILSELVVTFRSMSVMLGDNRRSITAKFMFCYVTQVIPLDGTVHLWAIFNNKITIIHAELKISESKPPSKILNRFS